MGVTCVATMAVFMCSNTSNYIFAYTGTLNIGKQLWDHSEKVIILKYGKNFEKKILTDV